MKRLRKKVRHENSDQNREGGKIPIIFSNHYAVNFWGIEKLHRFDAAKGSRIFEILKLEGFMNDINFYKPQEIEEKVLLKVHTKKYLKSLKWSVNAAKISEIPILAFVPNQIVQCGYLRPMRFQTAGSILAGKLAVQDGWSINLGGGFHHCCGYKGAGFCPYADITMLIRLLMTEEETVSNAMIVDLDAHQGNGHERDFLDDPNVFIMGMYNFAIYPHDHEAKLAIKCAVELRPKTEDDLYLRKLRRGLENSLDKFLPDVIVYNAGTDILENDPLGLLSISPQGVIERDEFVFATARKRKIPIVMLLSGGYLKSSAKVIADSILNLKAKGHLPVRM